MAVEYTRDAKGNLIKVEKEDTKPIREYTPRFSFEISEEQKARADKLLSTYGLRRNVFSIILDDLLDMIESNGMIVVGAILSKAAKPREVIPSMVYAEEIKDGRPR